MKLPNAEHAVVEIGKLRDYSLNPSHEDGKHKARVFRSALGLTISDAEWLRDVISQAAIEGEAADGPPSPFGNKYVIDINVNQGLKTDSKYQQLTDSVLAKAI